MDQKKKKKKPTLANLLQKEFSATHLFAAYTYLKITSAWMACQNAQILVLALE